MTVTATIDWNANWRSTRDPTIPNRARGSRVASAPPSVLYGRKSTRCRSKAKLARLYIARLVSFEFVNMPLGWSVAPGQSEARFHRLVVFHQPLGKSAQLGHGVRLDLSQPLI